MRCQVLYRSGWTKVLAGPRRLDADFREITLTLPIVRDGRVLVTASARIAVPRVVAGLAAWVACFAHPIISKTEARVTGCALVCSSAIGGCAFSAARCTLNAVSIYQGKARGTHDAFVHVGV
jgi:hypothetical protein